MAKLVHGGDIYSAKERISGEILDFSANINPLGMPKAVEEAAKKAVAASIHYPDPLCRELRQALSEAERVSPEWICCGNGAADLIFRLVLAKKPRRALLTAPTFAEYEEALGVSGCLIDHYLLSPAKDFRLDDGFLARLEEADFCILCNPNNPTGQTADPGLLSKILNSCAQNGVFLLVDECFGDFLDHPAAHSLVPQLSSYQNLMVLKAFTKLYAMPGLRLGYALCSDTGLLEKMASCGQPWGVSVPAQAAGIAALGEDAYREETRALIRKERAYLTETLMQNGFRVIGSAANYLFFYSGDESLAERLEEYGILIRSCRNYRGLDPHYFRIAVRGRAENEKLAGALRRLKRGDAVSQI